MQTVIFQFGLMGSCLLVPKPQRSLAPIAKDLEKNTLYHSPKNPHKNRVGGQVIEFIFPAPDKSSSPGEYPLRIK